jgi:S1-C subfamily serine protease
MDKKIDLALMNAGGARDTTRFHAIDLDQEVEYTPDSTSVGDNITLLGFSGGLTLGYDDVRQQIVLRGPQGDVISPPSIYHIEYDMNVEHGSSGAPVFNSAGKVIAINYMLRGTSRYGILSKYIRDLLENRNTELISSGN